MRIAKHIVLTGLSLLLWGLVAGAQERQWTVCAGDTGITYSVTGWENSTYNWTVEGGTITRNSGNSIVVDWPMENGTYAISVQEISEHGCAGEVKRGEVEVVSPELDLEGDTYICNGEVKVISPQGEFTSYLWQDGSTGSSYSTDQEGWIVLEVTNTIACKARDSLYLSVYELPVVDLGSDTTVCGDEGLVLDAGTDGINYHWSTGEISQEIIVYMGDGEEIWVEVVDEYGCRGGDTVLVDPCSVDFYFRDIPTAITPGDGNGLNDFWEIEELSSFSQAVVEIFDRWGTLVWRSEPGYSAPWDGRNMNGKEMPMDSYHFVIELNTGAKQDHVSGIITVIR